MCHVPSGTATPMLGKLGQMPGMTSAATVVKSILKDLGHEEISSGHFTHDVQIPVFAFMEQNLPWLNDLILGAMHDMMADNSGTTKKRS